MSTAGFHHVTMVSSDAARTLTFYRDLLALDLVKLTVNHDDPSAYHLYFGLDSVALSVPDADAQLRWKRRLVDAGVPVTGPYDRGYFRSIYFSDPDGQVLEIATAGPGYAFDEPADALGSEVITPAEHRLRGHRDEEEIAAQTHPEPVPVVTDDMAITGIHHVSGITDDVERAHEFYENGLGLRLVKKTVNQDDGRTPHWFWANYDGRSVAPGSSMTLFEWGATGMQARAGTGQTHHIAFRAADADEQAALVERLRSAGVSTTEVIDRVYFKSVYFRAPDGQLCEIATDGPGFAVDEPAESLGTRLVLPSWMEPDRASIAKALTPLPLEGAEAGR